MIKELLADDLYHGMFISSPHGIYGCSLAVDRVTPHEALFTIVLRYSLTVGVQWVCV